MTQEMPQAAGKAGQTNPAAFSDAPAPPRTDDELRRYAAEQLAEHLTIGVDLAARCQNLSLRAENDKVGPINAAARLMQANARVAEALATFAQVERRRRTISETIQKPDKRQAELNSELERKKNARSALQELRERMERLSEYNARAHAESESGHDRFEKGLAADRAKLGYVERKLAGTDPASGVADEDEEDEGDD